HRPPAGRSRTTQDGPPWSWRSPDRGHRRDTPPDAGGAENRSTRWLDGPSPPPSFLPPMITPQPPTIPLRPRLPPPGPLPVPAGSGLSLEGSLCLPAAAPAGVVVTHPHPLYGGDMDNPVVTAAVGACAAQGLATLRFNFRGVGASKGAWDEGRGEQDDVRSALALLGQHLQANARLALAGYSFGASMSSRVATGELPLAGLALLA